MLHIRKATGDDAANIVELIRQLADYEREADAVKITIEDVIAHGFGPTPFFECLIAEWEGALAGFALYFFNYSTWEGAPGLYLEDLFVSPEYRGRGIGKSLMIRLAGVARDRGCTRFQWQVLDWNKSAIEFYESIGAFHLKEWYTYRMESDAIGRLARQSADQ